MQIKNLKNRTKARDLNFLSFKAAITPAASAGGTCDGGCNLGEEKLPEEVAEGVAGLDEPGELTTDGGYHDCDEEPSC